MSLAALGTESEEMDAMVAYFEFISKDFESEKDISWRMENEMEEVPEPDVTNGSELFVEKKLYLLPCNRWIRNGFFHWAGVMG